MLASIWQPIASTGIVLVVLVFVLLEHETLRDRFIRVVGGTNIRLTTAALNDAGERLSRFFVSQFAVNLGVGVTIALGLALLGVPQAFLWGALATLLRFVPYIGVWLAALLATALAIAVDPGWSLAISTLVLFVVVELIAGQAVEPNLYGHTTGIVAALRRGRGNFLERNLGSDWLGAVDATHPVPTGRRSSYPCAELP